MALIVNKFRVSMTEYGDVSPSRFGMVIASSPEEAIELVRQKPWWYNEGEEFNYHTIKYPVTFIAKAENN